MTGRSDVSILPLLAPTPLQQAIAAAPERGADVVVRPEQEFFCFRLGELVLGVPSENVREVFRAGLLTPLPRMPSFVLGVVGHRGEVLPVLDLLRFLGRGEAKLAPRTRLFVGLSGSLAAAVATDQVAGLKRIPLADILPPPSGGDLAAENFIGVLDPKGPHGGMTLLHLPRLLSAARQKAVQK